MRKMRFMMTEEIYPRLCILILSGASLSVAGAVVQAVFANPLASPSVLGISTMGNLAITLALWFSFHVISLLAIPLAAFVGSFFSLALLYFLSKNLQRETTESLLLISIAISSLTSALQGAFFYSIKGQWEFVQLLTEWQSGSLTFFTFRQVYLQLPFAAAGLGFIFSHSEKLNILSLGEEEALHLGVEVSSTRWFFFLLVAVLLAGCLTTLGDIPFFCLLIPHISRYFVGADCKKVVLLSAFLGAGLLVLLDLMLHLFPDFPLSLNHLSSLLGALAFLILLSMKSNRY